MEEQELYLVVTTHDHSLTASSKMLAAAVNEKVQEGWIPLGGIAITSVPMENGGGHFVYAQAMVWQGSALVWQGEIGEKEQGEETDA